MITGTKKFTVADYPEEVLSKELAHLSEDDVNNLMRRYYEKENIQTLLKEYNIAVRPNILCKVFPPLLTDKECPYCDEILYEERPGRAAVGGKVPTCYICGHEDRNHCVCDNCKTKKRRLEEALTELRREQVNESFDPSKMQEIAEQDLNLETRLYLAAILREALDENMNFLLPLESLSIAPTSELSNEIVFSLVNQKVLRPDPRSKLDSFEFDENQFPGSFFIYRVNYRVNVQPTDGNYHNMIHRLMHLDPVLYEGENVWVESMWRKVALHEVLEYLYYSLNKVKYDFKAGEKTISIMEELLQHYSVSQVFGLIYRSIANTTKYQQESGITNKHAANLVVSKCQRLGERAVAEGWDITRFRRDFNLPQSALSELFFNRILKIGTLGFDATPTREI